MLVFYPNLAAEIARRGIKKRLIAERLKISQRSLSNKICGAAPFTWPEVNAIQAEFFADIDKDVLFFHEEDKDGT